MFHSWGASLRCKGATLCHTNSILEETHVNQMQLHPSCISKLSEILGRPHQIPACWAKFAHLGHLLHEARSCDDDMNAAYFHQFYPSNHGFCPTSTIQLQDFASNFTLR